MFKKIAIALVALMFSTNVSAAWVYYAEAQSQSAYGWGESSSLTDAKYRALSECAIRTPTWDRCYIVSWKRVWR